MNIDNALIAFSALSQETRLQTLKLLIQYGSTGVAAGVLREALSVPHNTLSFHLSHLSHAGLVTSRKEGRSVIYAANNDLIEGLIGYLRENCCAREEVDTTCETACSPKPKKKK